MRIGTILGAAAALALASPAGAQSGVTLMADEAGSAYHEMATALAEALSGALADAPGGAVSVAVEESRGPVENVMAVRARGGEHAFISQPWLVGIARRGAAVFLEVGPEPFQGIRALFPMPSLTMHVVVDDDTGAGAIEDLAGLTVLIGAGSFGATEGQRYLELFGLEDDVIVADGEVSNAAAALGEGRIDAFVTAGPFPAPEVVEAAAAAGARVLPMTGAQVTQAQRAGITVPAGTYPGQDEDVLTTSLPMVAYATDAMDDDTAHALTEGFWEAKDAMAEADPRWAGVTEASLAAIEGPLHPGAARYYEEAGIAVPEGSGG